MFINKRLDIQGLRAVAVISVVLYHAGIPISGGFVGVDIFFVISGYVITSMLHREFESNARIDFKKFYARRFRRLIPALSLVVFFTLLLSFFFQSPLGDQQRTAATAASVIFLSANIVLALTSKGYFDSTAESNPLLHTWSLSIEEQFYLFFPVLIVASWTIAKKKQKNIYIPLLVVSTVGFLSFGAMLFGSRGLTIFGLQNLFGFYSPITRAWEFAAGAFLALLNGRNQRTAIRASESNVIGILGGIFVVSALFFIDSGSVYPGISTLLPVIGTLLLIKAGSADGFITRCLSSPPAVKIGDWSYSIYIWHWPFISITNTIFPGRTTFVALAALFSFVPAILSYRFVESPARQNKLFFLNTTYRLLILTVFPTLVVVVGLFFLSEFHFGPKYQSQLHTNQIVYSLGCHWSEGLDSTPCSWNTDSSGDPVYLLGDSNAAHYVEGLITATTNLGRPLISNTSSGCPLLLLEIRTSLRPGHSRECLSRNERLFDWVKTQRAGTVVLSMSDVYFLSEDYSIKSETDGFTLNSQKKTRLMGLALVETIMRLRSYGHDVLLVQTLPHFEGLYFWDRGACASYALRSLTCQKQMPVGYALEKSKGIISEMKSIAKLLNLEVIDLSSIVCPNEICVVSAFVGSAYRDASHISVEKDKSLAPVWVRILR